MLALSTLSEDTREGLSKQDVIALAQPHSDSSFTVPTDPSKFYTAWASMKTLETKELVYRFGRPTMRYALTEEGWEVANRMKETVGVDNSRIIEPDLGLPSMQMPHHPHHDRIASNGVSGEGRQLSSLNLSVGSARQARSSSEFISLDELEPDERRRRHEPGPTNRQASRQCQRSNSILSQPENTARPIPKVTRTITSSTDPDFVEILDSPPPEPTEHLASRQMLGATADSSIATRQAFMKELESCLFDSGAATLDDIALAKALVIARQRINNPEQQLSGQPHDRTSRKSTGDLSFTTPTLDMAGPPRRGLDAQRSDSNFTPTMPLQQRNDSELNRISTVTTSTPKQISRVRATERLDNRSSVEASVLSSSRITTAGTSSFEAIKIPPGSFTVELIVDTREVRTRVDRDYIPSNLATLGVHCTSRAMELGDMLWVARIHDPAIQQKLDLSDQEIPEIVLDYIVERKRLDDLDASIKDSRFTEQKFRLKRSGVRNLIYLVEDYGSVGYMPEEQHQRLVTSITMTQVIDGLFVKRTRKLDETIAYLARMTRLLKKQYEGKPLRVIPSSALNPQNHIPLRNQGMEINNQQPSQHITYNSFASLVHKSGALTLRDVFLKMLMCTRGITGEKAVEVQRHWETPHAFVEELDRAGKARSQQGVAASREVGAAKKRELVWNVAGDLVGRRKIGKAVSARIGEIWGFEGENF